MDLYDKVRTNQSKEKVSILEDINFELELIRKDEINVVYILQLLAKLKGESDNNKDSLKKAIESYISNEVTLRSKRELIEKFLGENLLNVEDEDNVEEAFYKFVESERVREIDELSTSENLDSEKLELLIKDYLFTEKEPLTKDVIDLMKQRPNLKERKNAAERITAKIKKYVETFINGL